MASREDLIEELNLIQRIIERQASNSFKIKAWTVTLVVVALLFRSSNFQLFAAAVPLFVFWGLDAYFLKQERQYRELYDWVRENRQDTDEHLFDLNASRFKDEVDGIPGTMFSKTLGWFYGSIGALLILYTLGLVCLNGGSFLG